MVGRKTIKKKGGEKRGIQKKPTAQPETTFGGGPKATNEKSAAAS